MLSSQVTFSLETLSKLSAHSHMYMCRLLSFRLTINLGFINAPLTRAFNRIGTCPSQWNKK